MTNDQSDKPKRTRRWFRLQFSMQTMLVVIILSGLMCAVLLRPRLHEDVWAGGALKVRAERSRTADATNATLATDEPPPLHGRWILYDRFDRKLVHGVFHDGKEAGRWEYFDQVGRVVLSGKLEHGSPTGQWTVWNADDETLGRVTFAQRDRQIDFRIPGDRPEVYTVRESIRDGPAFTTAENGTVRVRGEFRHDKRHGPWVFFDRAGRKIREGDYVDGLQQGAWRRWGGPERAETVAYFVQGRKVDKVKSVLSRLEAQLRGGDRRQQILAAHRLVSFREAAVPIYRRTLQQGSVAEKLLAVRGLQRLGRRAVAATGELEKTCEDENARIRFGAMVTLAEIDPSRAPALYEGLLDVLVGDSVEHREQVQMALLRTGPVGLAQISKALDSSHPKMAGMVVELLLVLFQRLGDRPETCDQNLSLNDAAKVLELANNHADERVRGIYRRAAGQERGQSRGGSFGPGF